MRAAWWWIDRWRFSTAYREMSLAEQGAYRNLLDECWIRQGPLPVDETELAHICGRAKDWPKVREAVLAHFVKDATGWHNLTVEKIIRESNRKARNQARYRGSMAARESLSTGNVTGNVTGNKSGHVPRSLSPAEKNSDPDADAAVGGLLGSPAAAGEDRPGGEQNALDIGEALRVIAQRRKRAT